MVPLERYVWEEIDGPLVTFVMRHRILSYLGPLVTDGHASTAELIASTVKEALK